MNCNTIPADRISDENASRQMRLGGFANQGVDKSWDIRADYWGQAAKAGF
jgi:hypothetical protein